MILFSVVRVFGQDFQMVIFFSDQAMMIFNLHANEIAYKPKFQKALNILHGTDFKIQVDASKRMNIFCLASYLLL